MATFERARPAKASSPKVVRTSVLLPQEMLNTLQRMSKRSGSTMADVVRRAIMTEKLVRQTTKTGGKVLIKDKDNSLREVIFRRQ